MKIKILIFLCLLVSACAAQTTQINISSFGVNGADNKDDTQLFDKAVEYIATNGGILYIPEGVYILDQKKRRRIGVNNASYIFLANKDFGIKMHEKARLVYKNAFEGFRFRTTKDPNRNTIAKLNISIQGGIVDGALNNNYSKKNNPEIWGFVAEFFKSFIVHDLKIENFCGSAGIASYNNENFKAYNNILMNVSGNPNDYYDNHGDGIYVGNTKQYTISNNQIANTFKRFNRLGRIGICIEYELSKDGKIYENYISGYDRGIHVELIKGTANINNNTLEGNLSGIVLWNNYKFKQIVVYNKISNKGLDKKVKSILYTTAPILLLEYNTNNGTEIRNNKIKIFKEYLLPYDLMQITSSNISVISNEFVDFSKSLTFSVSQGKSAFERVTNIEFKKNKVSTKRLLAYDGSLLDIQNNYLDVEEVIISFDYSKNYYKGNIFKESDRQKTKINLYGKYN